MALRDLDLFIYFLLLALLISREALVCLFFLMPQHGRKHRVRASEEVKGFPKLLLLYEAWDGTS